MRERQILFTAPMVRAILAGKKTQTRRVIKPVQPRDDGMWPAGRSPVADCPYGQLGDRLWVRETHSIGPGPDVPLLPGEDYGALRWPHVTYDADGAVVPRDTRWEGAFGRKRPSIHMPRWACRIVLEITGVRVERLNDITEMEAEAEGAIAWSMECPSRVGAGPRTAYRALWEAINGVGSWAANPWVWVVEFKRVEVANG